MNYGIRAPHPLPDATRIGRVRLQVSDVARSAEFYQQVVGLRLIEQAADHALLGVDDVVLVEVRAGATRQLTGRHLGLYHFAILLPDRPALGRALKRLLELGIQPGAADHLVSEALYISDPDGLGIEIYRDRARSEWTVNGQQLAMASDPLDFDGLLSSASGSGSFSGSGSRGYAVPSGTVIGHVHLHVGDIDRAREFYHEKLGFDVMVWSYPGALFLSAGGYHHHLGLNTWAGPNAKASGPDEPKLLNWELVVPAGTGLKGRYEDPWSTVVEVVTSSK